MNITIVSGSQRAHSQSLNVAYYLQTLAEPHFDKATILDLHQLNLPFWNVATVIQKSPAQNRCFLFSM